MINNSVNILNLSDLHFSSEEIPEISQSAWAQRKTTLDSLIRYLGTLENIWKPHIIVISGDIGWSGNIKDYHLAKSWLNTLTSTLNLNLQEDLIICAGNHDVNRNETIGRCSPRSSQEADEWLTIKNLEIFERPFNSFKEFLRDLGLPQYLLRKDKNYLTGQRTIKGISFIVLNSAWFARGPNDRNNLWIGQSLLKVMEASGQIPNPTDLLHENIIISVLHHPLKWLADDETGNYNNRPGTYNYLCKRCYVILSGHLHEQYPSQPTTYYGGAQTFIGGASYSGDNYNNFCQILKIDKENKIISRNLIKFNPYTNEWRGSDRPQSYSLLSSVSVSPTVSPLNKTHVLQSREVKVNDKKTKLILKIEVIIELAKSHAEFVVSLGELGLSFKNKSEITQSKKVVEDRSKSLIEKLNRLGLNISIPSKFSSVEEIDSKLKNPNELMGICEGLSDKFDDDIGNLFLFIATVYGLLMAQVLNVETVSVIQSIRDLGELVHLPKVIIEKCVEAPLDGITIIATYL